MGQIWLSVNVPVVLQQWTHFLFFFFFESWGYWLSNMDFALWGFLCCWAHTARVAGFSMYVSPHQPCLENCTTAEYPVTWNLGNLGMCVFLWKRNNVESGSALFAYRSLSGYLISLKSVPSSWVTSMFFSWTHRRCRTKIGNAQSSQWME